MTGEADFAFWYMPEVDRTNFIWDCDHATHELTLEGNRTGEAGEVLANIQNTVRINVAKGETEAMCLCHPKGWRRA